MAESNKSDKRVIDEKLNWLYYGTGNSPVLVEIHRAKACYVASKFGYSYLPKRDDPR
jgi:hypothetical protein